ncbi:hypothetical protein Vretimale_3141 [Volvox reticuliferus]|uniref:Fungal lipase-type domain-containing protein n=1 Tax=Volvox reticuliferus TaxID=1737510 RepID=A0A8J4G039_9CHLO|nr:hypothetical protein Vretifemale_6648 [Volvox reticuliferus]GIL97611.1 hypothetical protein Vretimale_3141 [Volvox reticuliferus]
MSTGVVAASAAAVAMYWYLFKQKGIKDDAMERGWPNETCRNAPDHAPSNWGEALYHVKEVLRYMYNETLGRWHTVDLFVGLAYLSHRETIEYPAADIVAKGTPLGLDCSIPEQIKLMLELQEARRYMLYCKGLKLRREEMQSRFWKEHLGADTLTIIKQQPTAGVLRPAYVVINDHALRCVVLCIRGTHSMKDLFTSLAGAAKPHHVVDPDSGQPVLGYSHLGMLAAARWLARQATPVLQMALDASPGYQLRIVGHSMGGGAAALLTMMYRGGYTTASSQGVDHTHIHSHRPNQGPASTTSSAASEAAGAGPSISTTTTAAAAVATSSAGASATDSYSFLTARCVAIACPSVVTLELAAACREYVTSIIHGTDIVPTFCAASVDKLREDVTRSSWFSEFSRDMRSGVMRALQGGVRGVGTATQWTSRNILQPAVVPFRACYATTTTRKVRRRAASAIAQSTGTVAGAAAAAAAAAGGSAFSSNVDSSAPSASNLAQFSMAEQHEQLLLAGGAGGGADAAAAAVAALEGSPFTKSPGNVLPHSTSAGMLEEWGAPGLGPGGPARPPGTQSMASVGRQRAGGGASGVDQRAMAEAVQSCIYAVNSAVSAHHHHHQQQQGSPANDPALAEALGLLESLPSELGPGTVAAGTGDRMGAPGLGHVSTVVAHNQLQHHHPVAHQRSLEALDAADPRRRPAPTAGAGGAGGAGPSSTRAADSLFSGPTAAPLGAGGVSTAMVYGNSLRRRFWPWGQSQQQDGGGNGGCADGSTGPAATATAAAGLAAVGGSGQAGMCLPIGGVGMGFGAAGNGTGLGSASVGGSYSSLCEQEGSGGGCGGVGSMAPHRMDAPDSPGKAKAKAVPQGGMVSGGMAALASTRVIGDWLWGGMLFSTCTAPRRAMTAGPAALGSAAAGPSAARGSGNAGRAAARGSGSGALLMDVGDGFDDESDPDERGGARERRRRRSVAEQHGSSAEGDEEEDDGLGSEGEDAGDSADDDDDEDDEEEGGISVSGGGRVRDGGSGVGGDGTQSAAGAADSEQQLQAGITAVVAAVTNQATREAVEGPTALLRDENTLAAEAVLREVREADAAAAEAASGASGSTNSSSTRRRHGEERLRRREPRRGHVEDGAAGVTGKSSLRGVRDIGGSDGADVATAAASGHSAADPRVIGREASEGALGHGVEEEDEAPLSPGGSTINSPTGGEYRERSGISAAEYEARLYKRRLYPAGRILHLLPGCAISGQRPATAAAVQGAFTGGGAGSSTAAAACTNPIDATAARVSAVQAPHVLYEVRDPQAYSRVRLCRTMVSDHLIPAYLTALDSVLSQLEERQQRAAMDAWERELELDRHQQLELQQQNEQEERQ